MPRRPWCGPPQLLLLLPLNHVFVRAVEEVGFLFAVVTGEEEAGDDSLSGLVKPGQRTLRRGAAAVVAVTDVCRH
jgi:hypothetical protein